MSYPYPALLSLLQILCTPTEYQRITERIHRGRHPYTPPAGAEYWQVVPTYLYAECPLCGRRYQEPADTYSPQGWGTGIPLLYRALYVDPSEFELEPPCSHFLGIDRFVNLHDLQPPPSPPLITWWGEPMDLKMPDLINKRGEVPFLTPWFFPESINGYAVLHALPLCGIESAEFVPRFTVFILTYFSENPQRVIDLQAAVETERIRKDPEFYPSILYPPHLQFSAISLFKKVISPLYDLSNWAAQGKLGWLDISQADLPLQIGPGSELPNIYQRIHGKTRPYMWSKGRFRHI